jgi:hypothetical protein
MPFLPWSIRLKALLMPFDRGGESQGIINAVRRPFKDLGPLDIAPPKGVEGVPHKNKRCEKTIVKNTINV